MVLKRIVSCLAMVSVVFLLSCYDIQYDKESSDGNWYDGLSEGQVMKGMEIKGTMSDIATKSDSETTEVEKEVEVTWEWPKDLDEPIWEVNYQIDGTVADNIESGNVYKGQIYSGTSSTTSKALSEVNVKYNDTGSVVILSVCFKIKWCSPQTLLTVQVKMVDSNKDPYWNTVTFLVAPCSMTCKIRPGVSEADVSSKLYRSQLCILQGLDFLINPEHECYLYKSANMFSLPAEGTNWTLEPFKTVFFGIESDFTGKGFGKVKHHSSSSYCKVKRVAAASGVDATFEYKFEDLPKERLKYENGKTFDYDDVIFYVDLKK